MKPLHPIALGALAALSAPCFAAAQNPPATETQKLREEIQQLKQEYEQRIDALEQKLEQQEQQQQAAAPPPPPAPAAPSGGNAYNPKISLVLQGSYADFSSAAEPEVPGFVLGPETELRPEGLSLAESELVIESNVDDKFHAWATIAFENEDGETVPAVEEAYIDTLALPEGFTLKLGRFLSEIGYQNRQHTHLWEFADAPLVYRTMFANQLRDDGLQLKWIAPTDLYVELGAEALRGGGFPAGGDDRSGVNTVTAFAHVGGDVGTDHAWRAGASYVSAEADDRRSGEDIETAFTGDSDVAGVDFIWKWAPNGNPTIRNAVFQTEYFYREEDGAVVSDPDGAADASSYRGNQQGFYVQGIYQFMPKWRFGVRYDQLTADNRLNNPVPGTSLEVLADDGSTPKRYSAMVDWSNSEFSRLRLQYNQDESRPGGEDDNQWLLQYIYSIGSHPAHQF